VDSGARAPACETMSNEPDFLPLEFRRLDPEEQARRAREFLEIARARRSVRHFSREPVPYDLIETAIRAAACAPSGANQQPWTFVVVSDPEVKRRIREAAEREERINYERRFPEEWKRVLRPLGTDWHKEFLEDAPYLVVVFRHVHGLREVPGSREGRSTEHVKHYYVMESVGIACGFLLAALQSMGLAALTHTPSPMNFLARILGRPSNEKPFLLIPVGYPAPDAKIPNIERKSLDEVLVRVDRAPCEEPRKGGRGS
jgi:iodotyrosine deiodinase